ncbi:enoyl-CoA hydratase/isomerase family protein [Azohydromonas aeria]|uniref:enoyl-CoA hydratase/isomerase family protein n=1 Tax=Azohydromonas aeria TaxID=2590212 RepID=UPI0012F903FB|nr:enoyl-CoA hydratase/isomerase family protein [Azohydromonas aeria]
MSTRPDDPAGQPPELHFDGAIATITLRRPAVANRLELPDLDVLQAQLAEVNARPEVLVLRLRALGRHFCSGFNLGEAGEHIATAAERFEALAAALEGARPVTVAVINGGVYGGATDLALACDFRIGTTAAEMFVPAAQLGLLFYRGGMERFVARLGLPVARRILLAAERLDAAQMLQLGYLDRAVAPDALAQAGADWCARLARMAPLALLGMKRHLDAIARGALDAQALATDIARVNASEDLREGVRAWQEKRAPVFRGR